MKHYINNTSLNTNIIVTTSINPTYKEELFAKEIASQLNYQFCIRGKNTLNYLVKKYNALASIVAESNNIRLVYNKQSYGFHPNMAQLRVNSLYKGDRDRLIELAGVMPGDKILDCTCGLGSDAIVFSYAVGTNGKVTALEASPVLAKIVSNGFKSYSNKKSIISEAMQRIELLNENYNNFLSSQEKNSFDIVYFDPMFDNTFSEAQGIDIVRTLATYTLPTKENLKEAQRVAKKSVIIKDGAPGLLLKEMEIPVISKSKKIWYGRLNVCI